LEFFQILSKLNLIQNTKLIVFDFDGVVCDSSDECMVSAWNAWERWGSRENFCDNLERFSLKEKVFFYSVRPRVKGAGEYYILCRAFFEGIDIKDQKTYDSLVEDWKEFIEPFKIIFYDVREQLRVKNIHNWIKLHHVYEEVINTMHFFNDKNLLYIATLKDRESVQIILNNHGLKISQERLLDQSQIKSKLEALDRIKENTGYLRNNIVFIDDNITHLLEPAATGYKVFLTSWGPTIFEFIDLANKHKIPILEDSKILINKFGE